MGSVIFCTIVMVAVLGIVYRALRVVRASRLQIPIMLSMGALVLLSISMYLSPVPANTLRVVIGVSLLAWMLYVFIVSQIQPERHNTVSLSKDQMKKIEDLAKEVMGQVGADFDIDEVKEVKPDNKSGKPSELTPDNMMPIPAGTKVSTPEGNGVVELFIPTLEMVHNSEEFRNVKGYRVRMGDNNIRYFKATEVNQK